MVIGVLSKVLRLVLMLQICYNVTERCYHRRNYPNIKD